MQFVFLNIFTNFVKHALKVNPRPGHIYLLTNKRKTNLYMKLQALQSILVNNERYVATMYTINLVGNIINVTFGRIKKKLTTVLCL